MLHHVSVGVSDLARAARFYDRVLGALGYKRVMEVLPYGIAYGETAPVFWVQLPHDRKAAHAGNGVHVGFIGRSETDIESFHRAALEAGGRDEGPPGLRPNYGPHYFGAFVRDLDGNKLEAVLVSKRPAQRVASTRKSDPTREKSGKKGKKVATAAKPSRRAKRK